MKDLETKVSELSKAQEADKHENGLLKAQVERLQVELREYRKRLSMNSGINRSPTLNSTSGPQRSTSGPSGNFQFDFPKFGGLPGSQIFGPQELSNSPGSLGGQSAGATPPTTTQSPGTYGQQSAISRQGSGVRSMSPASLRNSISTTGSPAQINNLNPSFASYSTNDNMHGFAATLPQMDSSANPFGDLFSPSILKGAGIDNYFDTTNIAPADTNIAYPTTDGGDSTAGLNRVFQFNSGSSASDSTSPSASSSSQWNANGVTNSSCGTSPEPSHDSPSNKEKTPETADRAGNYRTGSGSVQPSKLSSTLPSDMGMTYGFPITDFSLPSVGNFDPVLFGDYRESQDAIVGGGDFNNGFFDESLNSFPMDYGSPSNLFGILDSPQPTQAAPKPSSTTAAPSRNLMAEVEKTREGGDDDYGLPSAKQVKNAEGSTKLISCNNIW